MKAVVFFLTCTLFAFAATNVENKIATQQKNLQAKSKTERSISRKLKDIAKDILQEQKRLKDINAKLDKISKNIAKNQLLLQDKEENLKELDQQNKALVEKKQELEDKIIKIIAEDFSFYLITDQSYMDSTDSILVDEVLEKMEVIVQKEFAKLSQEYVKINKQIDTQNKQIKDVKSFITKLKKERKQQARLKKQREKSLANLDKQKDAYRARLNKIERERSELRSTLNKLKIIKQKAEEKARQERLAKQRESQDGKTDTKLTVRQIGSSYQNSRVKKYTGKKTIAPLEDFFVKREFGKYTDPVYKIKIFNESVILRSNIQNAKVKNVLDGKVIYAKKTAVLDSVVIVENSYGIHTIYAHMSQIAPTIEVGKKIKKGYIIGRVQNELSFEVTQKSYHINPLDLIGVR